MKKELPGSYNELLSRASQFTDIELPSTEQMFNYFKLNPGYSNLHSSLLYIVDYVQGRYLAIGPQCRDFIGYNIDYIKDAGPAFYTGLWHKNDYKIFNEQLLRESLTFLNEHPPADRKDLLFTFNYRIKTKKGNYLKFRQRSAYFQSALDGTPLAAVGLVSNISSFKPDNNILLTVEHANAQEGFTDSPPLMKKLYFPDEKNSVLTGREIEILKWICEGLSSQKIAEKLYISVFTVGNHRKNILHKTNAGNLIEVIAFAIRNNLI